MTNNGCFSEKITFISNGKDKIAKLLFLPKRIIKIKNVVTGQELLPNGYQVKGNLIFARSNQVAFLEKDWLTCQNLPESVKNEGAEYGITDVCLFEPKFLASVCYDIEYEPMESVDIPNYVYTSQNLKRVLNMAKGKGQLNVTLFGDSISNAANSSGEAGFPPYKTSWYELAVEYAKSVNNGLGINFTNRSRSGYGTDWAVTVAKDIWQDKNDDLLIVAFGMNDGSANLSKDKYIDNIKYILDNRKNKDGAFILISSILPNPSSALYFKSLRTEYSSELKDLAERRSGGFIDMHAISEFLIANKNYCDISGNNFNHPNDFTYGFYETALKKLLTDTENSL